MHSLSRRKILRSILPPLSLLSAFAHSVRANGLDVFGLREKRNLTYRSIVERGPFHAIIQVYQTQKEGIQFAIPIRETGSGENQFPVNVERFALEINVVFLIGRMEWNFRSYFRFRGERREIAAAYLEGCDGV